MGDSEKSTRATSGGRTHLKIHLINGSVRSIKCTERVEMQVSSVNVSRSRHSLRTSLEKATVGAM